MCFGKTHPCSYIYIQPRSSSISGKTWTYRKGKLQSLQHLLVLWKFLLTIPYRLILFDDPSAKILYISSLVTKMTVRKSVKKTANKPPIRPQPLHNVRSIIAETEDHYRVDWEPSWEFKRYIIDTDADIWDEDAQMRVSGARHTRHDYSLRRLLRESNNLCLVDGMPSWV